jgi:transposase
MKTAVIGEGQREGIVYNRALIDLARHYGFHPKACKPYHAKVKGKVERPFRYIREDFFCRNHRPTTATGSWRRRLAFPEWPPTSCACAS